MRDRAQRRFVTVCCIFVALALIVAGIVAWLLTRPQFNHKTQGDDKSTMTTVMMSTSPSGAGGTIGSSTAKPIDMAPSSETESNEKVTANGTSQHSRVLEESTAEIVYEVDGDDRGRSSSSRSLHPGRVALDLDHVALIPAALQSTPALAALALAITSQEWHKLGLGGPGISVEASSDLTLTVERVTALFLIRLVALVSSRSRTPKLTADYSVFPTYHDYSTTTICRSALARKAPWPKPITTALIINLRSYLRRILEQYNGVHYHNFEHAYHVTISTNKLLDLMLLDVNETSAGATLCAHSTSHKRKTFGLKTDPLMHLAVLFSALIHDVDHKGVSNRQLVLEGDELAILYNDQSVAEQRSLAVAFSELRKPEFEPLRQIMFGPDNSEYMRFRTQVINLVLATDIASPERTQLVKSKWKEAFGNETKQYLEEQRKKMMQQTKGPSTFKRSLHSSSSDGQHQASLSSISHRHSMPPSLKSLTVSSASASAVSDLTMDSKTILQRQQGTKASLLDSLSSIQSEDDCTTPSSSERDLMDGVIQSGRTLAASSPTRNRRTSSKTAPTTPPSTPPPPPDTTPRSGNRSPTGNRSPVWTRVDGQLSPVASSRYDDESMLSSSHSLKSQKSGSSSKKKSQSLVLKKNDEDDHRTSPQLLRHSTDSVVASSQRTYASAPVFSSSVPPPGFRRYSSGDVINPYRKSMRLGIRRSLDFTGEAIEPYCSFRSSWNSPAAAAAASLSTTSSPSKSSFGPAPSSKGDVSEECSPDDMDDEPDELKATVIMEHLLRAADVGPNLQGWDHMKKWSGRLFYELKASREAGRCGFDPQQGWYENQITFLDSYVMPLAQKLQMMGVFGTSVAFDVVVEQNRQRWIGEGQDVTAETIQKWQIMQVRR